MKTSLIYSRWAKTAAVAVSATLAVAALMTTTAQARPYNVQDVQYVQVAPQLVITPPQMVIQAPVYVAPPVRYPRSVVVAPVVAPVVVPAYGPVYGPRYVRGHVYYINGRPYLNGYPYYRRHGHRQHIDRHADRHLDRHDGRHDQGRHVGQYR